MTYRYGYFENIAIWLDQGANVIFRRGSPDETLSSRAFRERGARGKRRRFRRFIDRLFFILIRERNHCWKAYRSEMKRRQMPEEFQREEVSYAEQRS